MLNVSVKNFLRLVRIPKYPEINIKQLTAQIHKQLIIVVISNSVLFKSLYIGSTDPNPENPNP